MSKEFINSFFELCLCLFEGYLYLTFWNHFLERRFRGKGKTVFMIFGAYLLPAASIVTFMGLAYSDTGAMRESPAGMLITTGSILIFLANIFLLGLYDRLSRVSNEMRKYERLENTNMLKQDHYVQMEKIQQQVHNITFYMQTIRALALEENWEKLIQLTREWDESTAELSEKSYSPVSVINAVLKEKERAAGQKGVAYSVMAEPGFYLPGMRIVDVIGILANLIDNALEAAEKRRDGFVKILLFKENDGRLIVLSVVNNYETAPIRSGERFLTIKEDKENHGMGIRYVTETAEHYGGTVSFRAENGTFTATVLFQQEKLSAKKK